MDIQYRWTNDEARQTYERLAELLPHFEGKERAAIVASMADLDLMFRMPVITVSRDELAAMNRELTAPCKRD